MSSRAARRYEADFVRWTEEQSRALREAAKIGTNLPLDWENLAEEVESLGRSQRRVLRSRIAVILEHLVKLERSRRLTEGAGGWRRLLASDPRSSSCSTIAPASRVMSLA